MPKTCVQISKSPTYALPGETAEHVTVVSDVHRVIEVDKAVADRGPKGQKHQPNQPKANGSDFLGFGSWRVRGLRPGRSLRMFALEVALRHLSGVIQFAGNGRRGSIAEACEM